MIDSKAPEVRTAMQEISTKLDLIFGSAIKEYCDQTGAEADVNAIPTYRTMNRMITG